jgi:hypothetical protein
MTNGNFSLRWAAAAIALGLMGYTGAASGQAKDVLAGTWKFNQDKTVEAATPKGDDRVREPETMSRGGRPTVGTNVVRGGAGDAGTGGRAGIGSAPGPLNMYARPQPQLVIVQTDSTITVSDPSGTPRVYYLDGRKLIEPLLGTDTLEVVARWKDGKLTAERKLGRHGTIREIYSMDPKKNELLVEVRITAPSLSPPLTQKRIYDLQPGG